MTAADLKHLHPDDVVLWLHVEAAVWRLVRASKAPVCKVAPIPLNQISSPNGMTLYGQCEFVRRPKTRILRFTVRKYRNGKFYPDRLPLHHLLDTIAHEVAHAKVTWADDHNANFFRAFGRLLLLSEKLKLRVDIGKSGVILPP